MCFMFARERMRMPRVSVAGLGLRLPRFDVVAFALLMLSC